MDGENHHHHHHNGHTSVAGELPIPGATTSNSGTSVHVTALDAIVNVNSLFTLAVFIGLAWNPSDAASVTSTACSVSAAAVESMVSFHVYSFASFLSSSLIALCLKQAIRIFPPAHGARAVRVNRAAFQTAILLSAAGSVFGCAFLMLALIELVQIKLGRIGCGGAVLAAVVPLLTLVPAAMLIYVSVIFYALVF